MRKLRRLPWRIPKNHHGQQQPAPAALSKSTPHDDADRNRERELQREREREMQPVAFAGGRYVYGACPAPTARGTTEIRRKSRHRVMPLPVPAL